MRLDWGSSGKMFPSSIPFKKLIEHSFKYLVLLLCSPVVHVYTRIYWAKSGAVCAHIPREIEERIVSSERGQMGLRVL